EEFAADRPGRKVVVALDDDRRVAFGEDRALPQRPCHRGSDQVRIWPEPSTIHLRLVRPSRPTGPRACSLLVEIPISAPSPYSKPSAKRVDALTITELESTSRRKRIALP